MNSPPPKIPTTKDLDSNSYLSTAKSSLHLKPPTYSTRYIQTPPSKSRFSNLENNNPLIFISVHYNYLSTTRYFTQFKHIPWVILFRYKIHKHTRRSFPSHSQSQYMYKSGVAEPHSTSNLGNLPPWNRTQTERGSFSHVSCCQSWRPLYPYLFPKRDIPNQTSSWTMWTATTTSFYVDLCIFDLVNCVEVIIVT